VVVLADRKWRKFFLEIDVSSAIAQNLDLMLDGAYDARCS